MKLLLFIAALCLQDPVDGLIEKLASDDLETRDKAAQELEAIGDGAVKALEKASTSTNADVASRAKQILSRIGLTGVINGLASAENDVRAKSFAALFAATPADLAATWKKCAAKNEKLADLVKAAWRSPSGLLVGVRLDPVEFKVGEAVKVQVGWFNIGEKPAGVSRYTGFEASADGKTELVINEVHENCHHDHDGKEDCTAFQVGALAFKSVEVVLHPDKQLEAGSYRLQAGQWVNGKRAVGPSVLLTVKKP